MALTTSVIMMATIGWIFYLFFNWNNENQKKKGILKLVNLENKSCKYMQIKTRSSYKEVSFEISENNALNLLSETDFEKNNSY